MAIYRYRLTLVDQHGRMQAPGFWIVAGNPGDAMALVNRYQDYTIAGGVNLRATQYMGAFHPWGFALASNVCDAARLEFWTNTGGVAVLYLRAPSLSIFNPDNETVNPSAIVPLIDEAINWLSTEDGIGVSAFKGGLRVQLPEGAYPRKF